MLRSLALAFLLAGPAAAQFETFERIGYGSFTSLDFGVTAVEDSDLTPLRVDLFGQMAVGDGGVFLSLPFSVVADGGDTVADGVGNLSLGGFADFQGRLVGVSVFGALMLPTASDDGAGFLANMSAQLPRLTDVAQSMPRILGLRLGASPRLSWRFVEARGDLGIDVAFPVGDGASDRDTEVLFRGNVGVGFKVSLLMLTAEFTNTGTLTSDRAATADDRFVHTAGLTLSLLTRYVDGHVGLVLPLGDSVTPDEVLAFTVGLRLHWDEIL